MAGRHDLSRREFFTMRLWRWMFPLLMVCVPAFAQSVPAASTSTSTPVAELPVVIVSGVQPGPGLWKVSKGEHVMWVLGTLSPLPRAMQWQSQDVEDAIGASQQLLLAPSIQLDAHIGLFGKLLLLPSVYGARKNDDGRTLQDVLPPEAYARWQVLKQKYLGRDRGIERWRPLFASQELYRTALKANGLSRSGGVQASIDALAKRHGVAEVPVAYRVLIEHPSDAIKAFKQAAPHDITCFIRTLDSVEHDLPAMTARANAWATGDLQRLRELPDSDRRDACVSALTGAGFAQTLGLNDVPAQLRGSWLTAARKALATNAQTFALLPMEELLKPDGYLARLHAEGYQVEAPE
jgi:hypothetical protein